MDILILTAFFGAGHYTVSKAIKEQALSVDNTLDIELLDFYGYLNPNIDKYFYKFYNFLTKDQPKLYNYFYNRKKDFMKFSYDDIVYKIHLQKISKYIVEANPKVVISTFPICSGIVSKFKEKTGSKIPLITCITDVVDSWEWIHPGTDKYFVPTPGVKQKLIEKGVPQDIIKVTGVPVRRNFLNSDIKSKKNQITSNLKNILIMGGGRGAFDLDMEFLEWLDTMDDTRVTIVAGTNEKLRETLLEREFKRILILGFVEDVASLMKQHNILISKPGGATIFEAINCEIPMIVKRPSIGQELANATFIQDSGIGFISDDTAEMKRYLKKLIESDGEIEKMRANIFDIKNIIETKKVGNYVIEHMYS